MIDLRAVDGLKGSGGADSGRGHKAARDARDERDQDPENWYKEYHKRSHKEGRNYGTKTINGVNLRCAKERNQDNEALARHILDNLRELLYLRYAVGLANDFRPAKAVLDMQPLPDLEKSVREYFALSKGPPSAYEARVVDDAQRIARTRHRE